MLHKLTEEVLQRIIDQYGEQILKELGEATYHHDKTCNDIRFASLTEQIWDKYIQLVINKGGDQ